MEFGKIVKKFTSKKRNEIVFRYPKKGDLDELLHYVNNLIAEDTFVLISGKPETREGEENFLDNLLRAMALGEAVSLVVERDGEIVGMVGVTRERFRMRHVGILGISISPEMRGEGIGEAAFSAIIEESKKMGLKLLTLHCFENNKRALHLYEKFGFKRAGIIPDAVFFKKEYIGQVIMYLSIV